MEIEKVFTCFTEEEVLKNRYLQAYSSISSTSRYSEIKNNYPVIELSWDDKYELLENGCWKRSFAPGYTMALRNTTEMHCHRGLKLRESFFGDMDSKMIQELCLFLDMNGIGYVCENGIVKTSTLIFTLSPIKKYNPSDYSTLEKAFVEDDWIIRHNDHKQLILINAYHIDLLTNANNLSILKYGYPAGKEYNKDTADNFVTDFKIREMVCPDRNELKRRRFEQLTSQLDNIDIFPDSYKFVVKNDNKLSFVLNDDGYCWKNVVSESYYIHKKMKIENSFLPWKQYGKDLDQLLVDEVCDHLKANSIDFSYDPNNKTINTQRTIFRMCNIGDQYDWDIYQQCMPDLLYLRTNHLTMLEEEMCFIPDLLL